MSLALTAPPAPFRELTYWLHRYRRVWRATIVVSVANPLMFLAAMGAGLGKLVQHNATPILHSTPYLQFFAPGLLAAAAMQNGFIDSAGPVFKSAYGRGNYRSAANTPMKPTDIYLGHLMFMAFRAFLSAAAFVLVLAVCGTFPWQRCLLMLPAAVLIGVAFSAPVAAVAIRITQFSKISAILRFVIMPMYMFSGTFYSTSQLPRWLHAIISVTPLYHGVDLCRGIALRTETGPGFALDAGYLLAMAVGGYLYGRRIYTRHLHA